MLGFKSAQVGRQFRPLSFPLRWLGWLRHVLIRNPNDPFVDWLPRQKTRSGGQLRAFAPAPRTLPLVLRRGCQTACWHGAIAPPTSLLSGFSTKFLRLTDLGIRFKDAKSTTVIDRRDMAGNLRRRGPPVQETSSGSVASSVASREESPVKPGGKVKIVHHQERRRKRKSTAIFLLGSLFGIIAAGFFAQSNDLIELPGIGELNMGSLFDVLPAGLVRDMRDLVVSLRWC